MSEKESNRPSQPYQENEVTLTSRFAQRVFRRSYQSTSGSLYLMGIVLRIIGTEEAALEGENAIDAILSPCDTALNEDIARLEKLCNDNGFNVNDLKYTANEMFVARITTPRGRLFLSMIEKMDYLVRLQDALWLGGYLTDAQYSSNCYAWQRRLIRVGNRIRSLTTSAIKAAKTKGEEISKAVDEAVKSSGVDLDEGDVDEGADD